MQAGGHFWLPLDCTHLAFNLLSSLSRMLSLSGSKTILVVAPPPGGGGVSALIDDTGLFIDGRIADLVAGETISIFAAADISLCINKCRFLVPNPEPSYPAVSPPFLSITTAALSSAAPPAYSNIASGRPLDSFQPSSAYPTGPLFH